MRIVQIACVITPENAYGGPTSVALGQCRALIQAGHDVTLVAGATGFDGDLPTTFQGIPVRLFPAQQVLPGAGFAGLMSPRLIGWLATHGREFDAAHVHLARDFITPVSASIMENLSVPTVIQPHGMIDPSDKLLARPMDAVFVRRILRAANRVFYLTEAEKASIAAVGGPNLRLESLRNGVDAGAMPPPQAHEGRVVLFLGRVHERKRPQFFVRAAAALAGEFPDVTFVMVGPDEGEGDVVTAQIRAANLGPRLIWKGPADRAGCLDAMSRADIYVLPSYRDTYPMAVLEALASGVPVVLADDSGLAPAIKAGDAGQIVPSTYEGIESGVRALLADPDLRDRQARSAYLLVQREFDMQPIVRQLLTAYTKQG